MATVLDQSYSETNRDDYYGVREFSTRHELGQQFIPTISASCNQVKFYLAKNGSPTGNIWAEIYSDNGSDLPNAQMGADSGVLDVSTISASPTFTLYTFTFAAPIALIAGTKYWIVANADYAVSAANCIYLGVDLSSPGYTNGIFTRYNNDTTSWVGISGADACFYEYYDDTTIIGSSGFFALM